MPESPDFVADAKDRLRLTVALTLRAVTTLDHMVNDTASRLWSRTLLPTPSDVRALRASISDLTRAVRDLKRASHTPQVS